MLFSKFTYSSLVFACDVNPNRVKGESKLVITFLPKEAYSMADVPLAVTITSQYSFKSFPFALLFQKTTFLGKVIFVNCLSVVLFPYRLSPG